MEIPQSLAGLGIPMEPSGLTGGKTFKSSLACPRPKGLEPSLGIVSPGKGPDLEYFVRVPGVPGVVTISMPSDNDDDDDEEKTCG